MTLPARDELLTVMAENRLQESFARSLDKVPLQPEESVTTWFYRVLRNGVIDHYRRRGASERALASLQKELEEAPPEPSPTSVMQSAPASRISPGR